MAQKKQNAKGELLVKARGAEYRLHFGMSVIADLQAKHGDKIEVILTAAQSDEGLPDMSVVVDIFLGSLQRYHGDVADRWLVDDIIAENADLLPKLMASAFPQPSKDDEAGNGKAAA